MAPIKNFGICLLFLSLLTGCVEGAATEPWDVTALNGDKMVGCRAVDVKRDMPGYVDLSALNNFYTETFEALRINLDEARRTGQQRRYVGDQTKGNPPSPISQDMRENYRKCEAHFRPKNSQDWFMTNSMTFDIPYVSYRFFAVDGKMVYVDVYVEANKKP